MGYVAGAGVASPSLTGAILADRASTRSGTRRSVARGVSALIPAQQARWGARRQ